MNFLAPAALGLSALSIPVILLYMLRLRRTEITISSNILWRQLVRDQEANAPWQRLRFSWLLFLQLLILAALVLALARPFFRVSTISSGRIVLLLDASASMNATDTGDSRFEQAKEIARDVIGTMSGSDSMTIIRVTHVPQVLVASESDGAVLRQAIDNARPTETSANWNAAFTLASAGVKGVKELQILVISDGGLPAGSLPTLPGEIRLVPVGESAENIGISALATRTIPGKFPQLFAKLTNYGTEDNEVIFSISLEDELYSANRYTIPSGSSVEIVAHDLPPDSRQIKAEVSLATASTTPDHLVTDNTAFAINNPAGTKRVIVVTERNIFLQQILTSMPGIELTMTTPSIGLPDEPFDLYVFDGWLPDRLPAADIFIINPTRDTVLFDVDGKIEEFEQTFVTEVLAGDPRTSYLEFRNVNIRAFQQLSNIENWATTLISARGGPLLIAGEQNDRQVAVLTFALQDSDLPLQLAWPILMTNLTQWFTPPRLLNVPDSISPGSAVTLRPQADENIRVWRPDGSEILLATEDTAQVTFAQTEQVGLYRAEGFNGDTITRSEFFAVNQFDPLESNITPRESVTVGDATIAEAAREQSGQREIWRYLALLGLILLLVEWIYYHRRALWKTRALAAAYRQPTFTSGSKGRFR